MVVTARTSERIIPKRESDGITPPIQREKETLKTFGYKFEDEN